MKPTHPHSVIGNLRKNWEGKRGETGSSHTFRGFTSCRQLIEQMEEFRNATQSFSWNTCREARHMPGFYNVRYLFYSDIEWLTGVLASHERNIAHWFDKCLLT